MYLTSPPKNVADHEVVAAVVDSELGLDVFVSGAASALRATARQAAFEPGDGEIVSRNQLPVRAASSFALLSGDCQAS